MKKTREENLESVKTLCLGFLAEAIGQCPAGHASNRNQDRVFAVTGFQYGAVKSASYIAGLDEEACLCIAQEILGLLNGLDQETVSNILALMPTLVRKEYPPIDIGGQAIITFYNSDTEEQKLNAATSLQEILRQIDEGA